MRRAIGLAAGILVAVGCNVMEPEGLGEHACEHAALSGTAVEAATSPDLDGDAVIEASGEPYTVTLPDGGVPGYLRLELLEQADVVLFVGDEGVFTSLAECDCPEPLPDPAPNGFCPDDIPEHFHMHLDPGVWHLEMTPSGDDSVWILLAPASTTHTHEH